MVGDGFMEVEGRAEGERLVAAVTDESVELTDAATEVGLAPHLEDAGERER